MSREDLRELGKSLLWTAGLYVAIKLMDKARLYAHRVRCLEDETMDLHARLRQLEGAREEEKASI